MAAQDKKMARAAVMVVVMSLFSEGFAQVGPGHSTILPGAKEDERPILLPINEVSAPTKVGSIQGRGKLIKISFSPDGRNLAAGVGKDIILADVKSGKTRVLSIPVETPEWSYCEFSFSPDGRTLAAIMGVREALVLWDVESGRPGVVIPGAGQLQGVSFSPDGRELADSDNRGIAIRDSSTGREMRRIKGDFINVAFGPDGGLVAALSSSGFLYVYDAASGKQLQVLEGRPEAKEKALRSFAFGPKGRIMAGGGQDGSIIIWDTSDWKVIRTIKGLPGSVNDLDFSPAGGSITAAIGPRTIRGLSPQSEKTGAVLVSLIDEGRSAVIKSTFCYAVAMNPEGNLLAVGCSDGPEAVSLWDVGSFDLPMKIKKDEFETTAEYEARIKSLEFPFSRPLELAKKDYNADLGGYVIELVGNQLLVEIERETARIMTNDKPACLTISGRLKYHDPANVTLTAAEVIDPQSGARYVVKRPADASIRSGKKPEA